jgi:hypothetical protein
MSKIKFEMLLMPEGQASCSNELQIRHSDFLNYVIKLSKAHTHLRRHFKDDGRKTHIFSSKVLLSLRKVAA